MQVARIKHNKLFLK